MRHAYAKEKYGTDTVIEAYAQSKMGQSSYQAHRHLGVTIADSQSEWTPLQRLFLQYAAKHENEKHDGVDPSSVNVPSSSRF